MTLTKDQLESIAPAIKPENLEVYVDLLNKFMPKYDIITPARIRPFLANLAEESMNFNHTLELASGQEYEGRKDLGNTQPGDGPRFRGRGLIQITGRGMYQWCSSSLYNDERLLTHPELLELPEAAAESACWFWKVVKGLNLIADKPDDWTFTFKGKIYSRFEWIVLKINGGQNGIADRKKFLERAERVIF